ncbi:hypothetical protein [Corynebacterium sp.]|uniref:hypothetical protein n=1 Tax=Corynebacterium sp. TaxID=1720 RepID=UPI0026DC6067|nr:hypothetical protein [Corynebacterium sp.]MDO4609510.1 hypothetical protein [Corynebacterium sp.]
MKWLTLATLVAAMGTFGILFLSAWTLPTDVNLEFTAYWGLYFALTGVLGGLMQETTRAVGTARAHARRAAEQGHAHDGAPGDGPTVTARPLTVAAGVAAITFVVFAVTGPFWMGWIVHGDTTLAVLLIAAGLASYAMQAVVSGLLSGAGLWTEYAWLIILDIVTRVALAVVAWLAGWGLWSFLVITVLGAMSWVIMIAVSPRTREVLGERADVPVRRFIPLMLTAMGASGASAALITGFPTIVKLADDFGAGPSALPTGGRSVSEAIAAEPGLAAAFITATAIAYSVNLTRAPLLMPLDKFQNAIIVRFVHTEGNPLARLAKPLGALVAFGLFGAVLAWLIGPWILQILPGDYMVTGSGLAALTVGATATAVLMVTGSVMLATNRHRAYLWGWLTATVVTCLILFGPGLLLWRTALGLVIGPSLGVALHLWAARSPAPGGAPAFTAPQEPAVEATGRARGPSSRDTYRCGRQKHLR